MHNSFSSSRLVRLLGEPGGAGAGPGATAAPQPDLAERLSQWVGVFDAVTLHAAHQSVEALDAAAPARAARPAPAGTLALGEQVRQVQAVLAKAIAANGAEAAASGRASRGRTPPPLATAAPEEPVVDFAPFRQRYLDLQRNMELMIDPLRANVQQALSAASPRLKQLALLDAAWDQMLGARAQRLLMGIPTLLERRFEQLRRAHADDASPAAWLAAFGQELQAVLLGELELRLEPVLGLVEAMDNATRDEGKPCH